MQSGISTSPPPRLAPQLPRLPPILHNAHLRPTTSWSKAPRGLFVLLRVGGIFTAPSISPSPPSRQRPDRSTFRAGRNLPDKEFRYLRTVIVTAAVYRGFSSELAPLPLTFRHWAGLSPYTSAPPRSQGPVFLVNSRLGLLSATLSRSTRNGASRCTGCPFSRSYGANLPSSLTEVLSSTLVCSTCPPVSVCGTGARPLTRGFSWQPGTQSVRVGPKPATSHHPSVIASNGFAYGDSLPAWRPRDPGPTLLRPPIAQTKSERYWNLNLLSITYASRPRLRPDSPAADQHGCGTLGHSVGGFALPSRYSCRHSHSRIAPDLLPRLLHC